MEEKTKNEKRVPVKAISLLAGFLILAIVAGIALVPHLFTTDTKVHAAPATNAKGMAAIWLDPNSGQIQFNADAMYANHPNTPIMFHIHIGSCSGPVAYMQEGKTDEIGHVFVGTAFNPLDGQHLTSIPKDWWVNVHDMTQPLPNGKYQSIGCGQVHTSNGSIAGYARIA